MRDDLFADTTDRDKDRLREVRALDRLSQGSALPRRRRDRWLRTVAYWVGAIYHLATCWLPTLTWRQDQARRRVLTHLRGILACLAALTLWGLALYIGGS